MLHEIQGGSLSPVVARNLIHQQRSTPFRLAELVEAMGSGLTAGGSFPGPVASAGGRVVRGCGVDGEDRVQAGQLKQLEDLRWDGFQPQRAAAVLGLLPGA